MADLEACYFCGEVPEGSLGEYAVVPAALAPTPDQQRSVVLCPSCREKLTNVMKPVVEAAGASPADGTGDGSDSDAEGDDSREPTDETPNEGEAEAEVSGDSADGAVAVPSADDGQGGAGVSIPPADGDPGGDGQPEESADAGNGGAGDAGADGADGREGGPPSEDPRVDDEMIARDSEAYQKTLRLLQNREFPVARDEIETVAANAYELDPGEVSGAIDALIQKGLISQEGSNLHRT